MSTPPCLGIRHAVARQLALLLFAALAWLFALPSVASIVPVTLAMGLTQPSAVAVDASYAYWGESDGATTSLHRVPLSGGAAQTLMTWPSSSGGIGTIQVTPTKLYVGRGSDASYSIEQVNPDGSSPQTIVSGIAAGYFIGVISGYAYYSYDSCCVARVPVPGGGTPQIVVGGGLWVGASAYNGGAIFAVDRATLNVYRLDLATFASAVILTGNFVEGTVVADATSVYFSNGEQILRIPATGGSAWELYSGSDVWAAASDASFLYFNEYGDLKSVPLSGGSETLLAAGANPYSNVAKDASRLYWATYTGAGDGVLYALQLDVVPVACSPGSFSATGYSPCTLAPVGSYVSDAGATAATPCPPGTYSDTAGAIACTPLIQLLDAAIDAALKSAPGLANSLHQQARSISSAPNAHAEAGKLQAFINHVNALRGKALTEAQADQLIALAMLL